MGITQSSTHRCLVPMCFVFRPQEPSSVSFSSFQWSSRNVAVSSSANFTCTEPSAIFSRSMRALYIGTASCTTFSTPAMPTRFLYFGMTFLVVVSIGPPTFSATNLAAAGPYRTEMAANRYLVLLQ